MSKDQLLDALQKLKKKVYPKSSKDKEKTKSEKEVKAKDNLKKLNEKGFKNKSKDEEKRGTINIPNKKNSKETKSKS